MNLLSRARFALAALVILQAAGCGGSGGDSSSGGGASLPPASPPPTQRATAFGAVLGTDDSLFTGTMSWKGVPYAKAPVGSLRWMPPVDPDAWTDVRPAQAFANACVQSGRLYGPGLNNKYDATIGTTLGQTLGSEDCLYLNIWAPARTSPTPRPVFVWVHGGSNITGYTADPVYDGATLARSADAIVVSVNYRLGIFGFLDVAQLKTGDPMVDSGNFAMLDLVQALKFVQKNIAAFGGDPGKVTLMGQSAGAVNVYALLTSPVVAQASTPLFHRLFAMSGGISTSATLPTGAVPTISPLGTWAQQGNTLIQQALIADGTAADATAADAWVAAHTSAQVAAYLRAASPDALLQTVRNRLVPLGLSGANPIPDGNVLPADPIAAIRAGHYLKVPVVAGIARDEVKLFPSLLVWLGSAFPSARLLDDATVFNMAYTYQPDAPPATTFNAWVPAAYGLAGFNYWTDFLNQYWFEAGRDDVLNALKSQQAQVWHYRFDWDEEPAPFNDIFGAAHTTDLPFVFGNFGPSLYSNFWFTTANRPGRVALSAAMIKSLGSFARNGDPNDAALGVTWNPWPAKVVFDADQNVTNIQAQ